MGELNCKRIYDVPDNEDGFRILVDRLWPRGIKKETAGIDLWAKEIAPSDELRKWYGHEPERFQEFRARYLEELASNPDATEFSSSVKAKLGAESVTLLYAAKDIKRNNAVILKDWLEKDFEV